MRLDRGDFDDVRHPVIDELNRCSTTIQGIMGQRLCNDGEIAIRLGVVNDHRVSLKIILFTLSGHQR